MKKFTILLFIVIPFISCSSQTMTTKVLSDSIRSMSARFTSHDKSLKLLQDSIKLLNKKIDSLQVTLNPLDFTVKNRVVSIKRP